MKRVYVCCVCGHMIDEADYLALPDEVTCPECGVSKHDYELQEIPI